MYRKKKYICSMSKMFQRTLLLLVVLCMPLPDGLSAQILPMSDNYRNSTFSGTLDVTSPVLFENCTFETDATVLRHSYGALFRNCTFTGSGGTLYLAESGSGMILVDCIATGCSEIRFSLNPTDADRNYVCGLLVNGEECSVLDEQEYIIDIEGLELEQSARGLQDGPLVVQMTTSPNTLNAGDTATVLLTGLTDGMFVGWFASDTSLTVKVEDPFICRIIAPDTIGKGRTALVSAYTEYGLEAACEIALQPEQTVTEQKDKARKNKKKDKARKKEKSRKKKK